MKVHFLKSHPEPFNSAQCGYKTHEFRRDDGRGFAQGDLLVLAEWKPNADGGGAYTGHWLAVRVTYVGRGFGIPDGYVALSIWRVAGGDGFTHPEVSMPTTEGAA